MNITKPIKLQVFIDLTNCVFAILENFYCFTSSYVHNLEAKSMASMVPQLTIINSENCCWSLSLANTHTHARTQIYININCRDLSFPDDGMMKAVDIYPHDGLELGFRHMLKLMISLTHVSLTEWPTFRRRHVQTPFHEWKYLNFIWYLIEICSLG